MIITCAYCWEMVTVVCITKLFICYQGDVQASSLKDLSMSSQSTPRYPPPPGLPGSRPSQSFEIIDSPGVDPDLINPAGTEPTGTPAIVSGNTPKDESSAFVFPPPHDTAEKKKSSKIGNLGGSFRGGFGKFKGLFKKGPKPTPQLQASKSIEDIDEEELGGSREFLDETAKTPPYPQPGDKNSSKMDQLGTSLRNIFKKPQNADPAPYTAGDVVELKETSKKSYLTFGNFIVAMLITLMVSGIIMCACIGVNNALYYIGPAAIGLAFFALIGKCFFTLSWDEDPLPPSVKRHALTFEKMLVGVKDPYGLQSGKAYKSTPVVRVYHGPMTTTTVTTTETLSHQPQTFDESIDTRFGYVSKEINLYGSLGISIIGHLNSDITKSMYDLLLHSSYDIVLLANLLFVFSLGWILYLRAIYMNTQVLEEDMAVPRPHHLQYCLRVQ